MLKFEVRPMVPLGFDFGTTNSAMAILVDGRPKVTPTFRSVLYFDPDERGRGGRPLAVSGSQAIQRYLEGDGSGRLIQSMKSHLASRHFKATSVFHHTYTLEDLIAFVVEGVRKEAEKLFGSLPKRAVVGRPVRFAGEEENQDYALDRLRTSVLKGGFDEVIFEYEPMAAAYHYESALDHDELVLIADFGGGTSDFCLVRVGVSFRSRGHSPEDILGAEGVAIAGDAFDSRVVQKLVAPSLGKGTTYLSSGKEMPIPPWLFTHVERWHHLSFLKSKETLRLLDTIERGARAPAQIASFVHLVTNDLGYHLYRAVERTKLALSGEATSLFTFEDEPIALCHEVGREAFELWIEDAVNAISDCVTRLLDKTGVATSEVDKVFMTGGSSLVPVVRRIFSSRFGEEKIQSGDELVSVASGLALRARDLA